VKSINMLIIINLFGRNTSCYDITEDTRHSFSFPSLITIRCKQR
jgi:hypothetical protein